MNDRPTEVSVFKPTNELSRIFGKPALVGSEKLEDYERLWTLVASTTKPVEVIGYMLTKDITDWSWEMQRERAIKVAIIEHYKKEVVAELIKSALAPAGQLNATMYRTFQAGDDLTLWATDPGARARIEEALAKEGHSPASILAQAFMRGASQINTIDNRISAYERRRNAALREHGLWSDRFLRQLDRAPSDVIDGEFTDVAK